MRSNPYFTEKRWWHLIHRAVENLNNRTLEINQKKFKFPDKTIADFYAPNLINADNVNDFLKKLKKAVPAFHFAQFDFNPRWVNFKYQKGDLIRVKLIVTSSQVIGVKRSEITLNKEIYRIQKLLPYISKQMSIEKAYVCIDTVTKERDVFDEEDITLTRKYNGI